MCNELPPRYAMERDDLLGKTLASRHYLRFKRDPKTGLVGWSFRDYQTRYVTPFTHGLLRPGIEPARWAQLRAA